MSNLGLYQSMTTLSKKVGGPLQLATMVAVGGYIIIRSGEAGIKKVVKIVRKHEKRKVSVFTDTYVVHSMGKSNEGLLFNVGDKYRVLEFDRNSVLIEKIGDANNPYFVSGDLLRSISNFNH